MMLSTRMKFVRNWKISVPVAGVVVAGLAWLAFGFFGIQTAFIDDEVAEALPEFDLPAAPPPTADEGVVEESAAPLATDVLEAVTPSGTEPVVNEPAVSEPPEPEPVVTEPLVTETAEPVIVAQASGTFSGTDSYDVMGDATVLGNGTGQRFLRFENFESDNGPDLNVYLFNPDDQNDFIDLGDLSGNIGDQNYELAADIDLGVYRQVSIWCVRFSAGFGFADLVAA
jgi:hypothetical protein